MYTQCFSLPPPPIASECSCLCFGLSKLIYVHFADSKKTYIFRKIKFFKTFWELTVYVQVYLFIILYSHWIAANIIQYLPYLVVLVYEYLSVFTHLYMSKWGLLLYQRIIQPFFRNTRTFHGGGGTPILRHGRKVSR